MFWSYFEQQYLGGLGGVGVSMAASYADDPGSIPGNGTHVMCHRAELLTTLRVKGSSQSKVL